MTTIKITLNEVEDKAILDYIKPLVEEGGRAAVIARNMLHRCVAREMGFPGTSGDTESVPTELDSIIGNDSNDFLAGQLDDLF